MSENDLGSICSFIHSVACRCNFHDRVRQWDRKSWNLNKTLNPSKFLPELCHQQWCLFNSQDKLPWCNTKLCHKTTTTFVWKSQTDEEWKKEMIVFSCYYSVKLWREGIGANVYWDWNVSISPLEGLRVPSSGLWRHCQMVSLNEMFFILHSNVLINFNDQLKHAWRKYDSDLWSSVTGHLISSTWFLLLELIIWKQKFVYMTASHLTSQGAVFVLSYLPG